MGQQTATSKCQHYGVIICKDCEKEIEKFHSERVTTQYGICTVCKSKKN